MTTTKIRERIALLLRKAESTTPEEAEALTEHAERLMLRHGIDMVQVQLAQGRRTEDIVKRSIFAQGVYGRAMVNLVCNVARAMGGVETIYYRSDGNRYRIDLFGYKTDTMMAETLVTSLMLQASAALKHWWRHERDYYYPKDRTKARRDFIVGFGQGAANRIKETRRRVVAEAESTAAGTAVALLDRNAKVKAHVEAIGFRKARSLTVGSSYANGFAAGVLANVGGKELE